MFEKITVEEFYTYDDITNIIEMRPTDLRDNTDRDVDGLNDWQTDFPRTTSPDGRIDEGFVIA